MTSKTIYFPGLNGLRAIAALAVVISHTTLALNQFGLDPFIFGRASNGDPQGLTLAGFGVSIFFALSGFLITYLLQKEKEVQSINIKKFYIRRILRIWPLYYLYLLISVVITHWFGLELNIKSLFLYIFYAANIPFILGTSIPLLAHYWSLGVEEQFYLFWPWFNSKINTNVMYVTSIFLGILISIKLLVHFFYPDTLVETAIGINRFDCMIMGALGALFYKQSSRFFSFIIDNKLTQFICWAIILLIAFNKFHIMSILDDEIVSVVTVCLIVGQINIKNRIVNLETNVFDFLGKISYGIYVIHLSLIFLFSKLINMFSIPTPYKYFVVYFSITSTTIFLAWLSYTYFEKYFLTLKEKFSTISSSGTKHIKPI